MRYQITCVNKSNGIIVSVGCWNGTNQTTFSEQDVISKIANGDTFHSYDYSLKKWAQVLVMPPKQLGGRYFIKTAADCTVNNNLDNLPSC